MHMGQDWTTTYPEFCPEQNKRLHDRLSPTLYPRPNSPEAISPETPCPVPTNKRDHRVLKNSQGRDFGLGRSWPFRRSHSQGHGTPRDKEMQRAKNSLDYILDTIPAVHDLRSHLNLLKVDGKLLIVGAVPKPLQFDASDLILGMPLLSTKA
ncbi:hypothetical protein Acr_01g0008280 [Actinidia rufa]|uniref:Uncharacterized protein n=1 Tax=Actinidia rufa TaxID=165716 RepID=A0A7J0E4Z2_9ERIC|nr:hypothetical protein Acr_01g0008280 [Actinidia rufa]